MLANLAGRKKNSLPISRLPSDSVVEKKRRELSESARERMLKKIAALYQAKPMRRDQYRAGEADGISGVYRDLTDILFAVQHQGLGRAVVLQESNSHVVFRVENCACCQVEGYRNGCHYLAGFLAGALRAAGRPDTITVSEVSCGQPPRRSCVFMANW